MEKAMEEWKAYVAQDEQLKEDFKELFEEEKEETTEEETDQSKETKPAHTHTPPPQQQQHKPTQTAVKTVRPHSKKGS
jgi:hypothetical protein